MALGKTTRKESVVAKKNAKRTIRVRIGKKVHVAETTDLRPVAENANQALTLTITEEHIKKAVCKDAGKCVIAQALMASPLGQLVEGFQIGPSTSKVYTREKIVRYKTPGKLAKALKVFDVTGKWHLPVGQYTLLAPQKGFASRRWEKAKRKGGKQDVFKGRALPTRRALSVTQLMGA
jgi:hypothetical protein